MRWYSSNALAKAPALRAKSTFDTQLASIENRSATGRPPLAPLWGRVHEHALERVAIGREAAQHFVAAQAARDGRVATPSSPPASVDVAGTLYRSSIHGHARARRSLRARRRATTVVLVVLAKRR